MATYRAYVYCKKCDRPLREKECRSETVFRRDNSHTTYYCLVCNAIARKPFSMAAWVGIALLTCAMAAISAWFIDVAPVDDVESYSEKWVPYMIIPITMLLPLFPFVLGWWKKSKCKPIYDRWVMQHGTDPDKWPDANKPK